MPRTIVLTLAPPNSSGYGSIEHWSVSEDGRICDGLCWDEMLGAVARITLNEHNSYSMQTVEDHKDSAVKHAQRRPNPLYVALKDVVAGFDGPSPVGVANALATARKAIAAIDDADEIPF